MEISVDFTKKILDAFAQAESVYLPVYLLASKIEEIEGDSEDGNYCISDELVLHLLHLQDLECIENMRGHNEWGYEPAGGVHGPDLGQLIRESIKSEKFDTPHCYDAESDRAIIRLTATGVQMNVALNSSKVGEAAKQTIITFGKAAISKAAGTIIGG